MNIEFTSKEKRFLSFLFNFMDLYNCQENFFISGGFIRDKILKRQPKDMDIIFYDQIFLDFHTEIKEAQKDLNFEIISVKEDTYGQSGISKRIKFLAEDILVDARSFEHRSLASDSKTRDFTMNSIYFDIYNNKLIDINIVFQQGNS